MDYTQMRFEKIADELELILAQVKDADYSQLDEAIGEYYQYDSDTIFAYPQVSEDKEKEKKDDKKKDDKKDDDDDKDDKKDDKKKKGKKKSKISP